MNLPCQPFGHSQPAGHDNPKATDHVCSAAELTVLCSNKECGELRKNSNLPLKFPQHSAKATILYKCLLDTSLQVYVHTHLTALFWWAGTRKVKPIWILLKQETVSGSGISWAICKSAPRSRQITMPTTHHSVFYRPDALPAAQPTASKHWRPNHTNVTVIIIIQTTITKINTLWQWKLKAVNLEWPVVQHLSTLLHRAVSQ